MVVIGFIPNVTNNTELSELVAASNDFAWHSTEGQLYIYEPTFKHGDIASDNGGFWVKEFSVEALDLQGYKEFRYSEIDQRTEEKIGAGFSHNQKVFSLSSSAQTNILALDHTRNDPSMTYPIKYNTINDDDTYMVPDADDLHTMYLSAVGTKKHWLDTGTDLKDLIRAAVDYAGVQTVVDYR